MSEAVIERPNFWKAWLLHCLVREQAPNAATRKGFWLKGNKHNYKLYLNAAFLKQLCVIREVAGVIFVPINVRQPCWERLLRKSPAFLKLLCCRASLAGNFLTHASLPMAQHMTKKQQQCWRMQKENPRAREAGQKVFPGHGQPGGPSRTQMMCKHLTDCTGSHHVSLDQLTESTMTPEIKAHSLNAFYIYELPDRASLSPLLRHWTSPGEARTWHLQSTFYRPWEPLLLLLQSQRRGKQQNNSAASPRGQGMLHLEFNTPTRESRDLEQGSGDYCRQPRSVGQPKKAKLMVRSCKKQEPKQKPGKSATCFFSALCLALDILSPNKCPWDWTRSKRIEEIPRKQGTPIGANTEKKSFGRDKQWDSNIRIFSAEEVELSTLTSHIICDLIQ